jgi:hypothetical protein
MPLITSAELNRLATEFRASDVSRMTKSADVILLDQSRASATTFDVFLSHSFMDATLILGLLALLTKHGIKTYVDWIVDPQLDRNQVSSATAERVRERMRRCGALLYAHSNNAATSKWMPWELGYFDGFRSTVAIVPIAQVDTETFSGREYLGLYPYIDASNARIWINRGSAPDRIFGSLSSTANQFKPLRQWLVERAAA